MFFSTTLAATAVFALANGAALMSRSNSGEATFYGGNTDGGMCSLVGYSLPSGVYGVAMSDSNWENSQTCGGCIEVTGPKGNKIIAMVTDQCPGCGPNHLDLYPDAFAKLDDPSKGIIQVSWNYVTCPIASPIVIRNKSGTSPYWFSMQAYNAKKRVESLEFSTNGGSSWTSTQRMEYNYFQLTSGSGTSSVDVKVTSIDGDVVIVKDVPVGSSVSKTGGSNFGSGSTAPEPVKAPAVEEPVAKPTTTTAAPYVAPVIQPVQPSSTQAPAPIVVKTTTSVGAIFQESTVPAYVQPQPTTFATTTTKPAAAPITTTTSTTSTTTTKSHASHAITQSPAKVETAEPEVTVTVTVNGCPAYLEG